MNMTREQIETRRRRLDVGGQEIWRTRGVARIVVVCGLRLSADDDSSVSCQTCMFYTGDSTPTADAMTQSGECRHDAPSDVLVAAGMRPWPVVRYHDACGRWLPTNAIDDAIVPEADD